MFTLGVLGLCVSGVGRVVGVTSRPAVPISLFPVLFPIAVPVSLPVLFPIAVPVSLPVFVPVAVPISLPVFVPVAVPVPLLDEVLSRGDELLVKLSNR